MALSELSTQQSVTSKFNEYFSAKNCSSKSANESALMEEFSSLLDAIASQISEMKLDNQPAKNNNQNQTEKNDYCFQNSSDEVKNNQVEKQAKVSEEEDEELEEDVKEEKITLKESDKIVPEDEVLDEDEGEEIVVESFNQNVVEVAEVSQPVEKIEENEEVEAVEQVEFINQETVTECSNEEVQKDVEQNVSIQVQQPQVKEDNEIKEIPSSNEDKENVATELVASDEVAEEISEEVETDNNSPVSMVQVETKIEEDGAVEKISVKESEQVEIADNNQVEEVKDEDKKEVSLIMQILEEKASEAGEMSEAIVADVIDSQGENFDASASYAQIWQSQYLNDVSGAAVTTLINSEKISEEQSAQNMVVQGTSGIGFDNNSSSEQIVKEFASSKEAGTLPRSQVTSMMSRVENALKEIARSKDGKTISIKLNPEELGSVKIDVSIRDGKLHARLTAENPLVNQSLREKAAELQQILRNSGIEVDEVSVSVGSSGESFDEFTKQQTQQGMRQGVLSQRVVKEDSTDNSKLNYTVKSEVSDDHWIA